MAIDAVCSGCPSLLEAVYSQLSLKLDLKRGFGDVLVVDRIEKTPTQN
jgi:uncharacterized protein (TIGR03435 family)